MVKSPRDRVLIGGSGDEVSNHWLQIVAAATHPEDETISQLDTQMACRREPEPTRF